MNIVRLILPILIPSWRFFDRVGPAPLIQICRQNHCHSKKEQVIWEDIGVYALPVFNVQSFIQRLFWSPLRNEYLYLVSLSERLICQEEEFAEQQIFHILTRHYPDIDHLQFRLVFADRDNEVITNHVVYTSCCYKDFKQRGRLWN